MRHLVAGPALPGADHQGMDTDRLASGGGHCRPGTAAEVLKAGFGFSVLSVALMHLGAVGFDLVLPTAGSRGAQAATSAVAAALLGAVVLWHRVRALSPEVLPHVVGVVASIAGLSAAVHLVLTADPLKAMPLMLVVAAAGAVVPMLGWLLAVDALALLAVAAGGLPRWEQPAWQHVAVMMLFSVAAAHLLHEARGRAQRRLDQLTDALVAQATRDELTGLLNRRGLHTAAGQLPSRPGPADRQRHGDQPGTGTGAMYLDVDGFKRINDELGHAAGDALLVEVADRLACLVRTGDLVARVGGDEFAVVLPQVSAEQLTQLAHRARIRLTGTAGVLQLPWTVSVGTALNPATGPPGARRPPPLQAADLAMYQDKQTHWAGAAQL